MAAITTLVFTGETIPFPSATPGGLVAEIWSLGTSAAGDTQTISVAGRLQKVLYIIGGASHLAAPGTSVPVITTGVVAASNFAEVLVVGPAVT